MCGIVCTIQDITSSLYDLKPPCLCHHTNDIWPCALCICVIASTVLMISHNFISEITSAIIHDIISLVYDMTATVCHHNHCFMTSDSLHMTSPPGFMTSRPHTCDITATMFVNTSQLYLTSNTGCWENTTTIFEITTSISVSVWSHRLYRWYNTHCIYDMAPTIFMAQYALYMTSHPWFMTSQPSIHYISLLYLISNWLYFTAHPLYLRHHTQITDHMTLIYMITEVKYAWHHMNTYDITYTL